VKTLRAHAAASALAVVASVLACGTPSRLPSPPPSAATASSARGPASAAASAAAAAAAAAPAAAAAAAPAAAPARAPTAARVEAAQIPVHTPTGDLRLEAAVVWPLDARQDQPRRAIIFNHGSPMTAAARELMTPLAYSWAIQWFVSRGYVVLAPLRRGFGASQGRFSKGVDRAHHDYAGAGRVAGADIAAALAFLQALPGVDRTRIVLAGHSAGSRRPSHRHARRIPRRRSTRRDPPPPRAYKNAVFPLLVERGFVGTVTRSEKKLARGQCYAHASGQGGALAVGIDGYFGAPGFKTALEEKLDVEPARRAAPSAPFASAWSSTRPPGSSNRSARATTTTSSATQLTWPPPPPPATARRRSSGC
jgi:hypothetical protein